jgi:hypothetical protein
MLIHTITHAVLVGDACENIPLCRLFDQLYGRTGVVDVRQFWHALQKRVHLGVNINAVAEALLLRLLPRHQLLDWHNTLQCLRRRWARQPLLLTETLWDCHSRAMDRYRALLNNQAPDRVKAREQAQGEKASVA